MFIKLHPKSLAWYISEKDFGVVQVSKSFKVSSGLFYKLIKGITDRHKDIVNVIIEKPYLRLNGDDRKRLARDIIHIQRLFGSLLSWLEYFFPAAEIIQLSARVARKSAYNTESISKDQQLSEIAVILPSVKQLDYCTIELFCIHDCLVLKRAYEQRSAR
ncbi:hypothetical protein [Ignavibacterium sp.]|uniref:hypothetical protein n=1 Tax=Ignavibacterium sp. TaxID=2651167 RepID=UPI002605B02F|nr:hypothetical protein [Ignavibacterium sp.]